MTSTTVVVVVLIVVAAGAAGLGFYAGYQYRGSPASTPSATENTTLSILAAGTLNTIFPQVANLLVNQTPGITAPSSAQTYEGSLNVVTAVSSLGARADVVAVADFRLIPQDLEPSYASYQVVFGATPEVLCFNPSLPAFSGINESNWAEKLTTDVTTPGNKPMAVWNASTDPNGYNEIFSLQLQGMVYGSGPSAYYPTFYSGGATSPAVPNPATTIVEKESQAASLLNTGVVSALITYRSYAVANHLTFVSFNPIPGLQANDSAALADYSSLSTTIVSSTGTFTTVHPAPVLFAVTVPLNAPNPALGAAFINTLLAYQGLAILSAGGAFTPVTPAWSDHPSAVPPVLAPNVGPMPEWAAALLG